MALIEVRELRKEFRVYRHHRGMTGAVRNLLSREYRVVRAVDGLSLDIEPGELIGYLGPNGAGKSTTVKILTGILVPTAGSVQVRGLVPWRERIAHTQHIGVVFGQRINLWWDLPLVESYDLLRYIYQIPLDRFRNNLAHFKQLLQLGEFFHTPVRHLSLGQRMRGELAAALLHDPDVVFLDEPTIGLDVVAKERIRAFIAEMNRERGVTVILTTHDLGDVQKLCKRVMMIDRGRLIFDGTLADLLDRYGGERELMVEFVDEYAEPAIAGARVVAQEGSRVTYRFQREQVTASELIGQLSSRYHIKDLTVREPDVESTVRRIYEERLLQSGPL